MRDYWTLAEDLHYLNHGSFGAVPALTQQEIRRLQEVAEANPMQWFRDLPMRLASLRERFGEFLGVHGDDLALVTNATTGINVALRSIRLRPGQRIVTTSHAYGAVLLVIDRVAREAGCDVVVVDIPTEARAAEVLNLIGDAVDERAGCVVVDQITSATAKMLPVHGISDLGRSRGVPVVVDGAHAPGLVDAPVVGDYWTGNLHKWPCAPRGTAVLYVAPERQETVVPGVISWGDPAGFPISFDQPGTTDATAWLAAPTSLDLMAELGFGERRAELEQVVVKGAGLVADAIGQPVIDVGDAPATMRVIGLPPGLVTDFTDAARLSTWLAERTRVEVGLSCWRSQGLIRLSAHLYNSPEDYVAAAERYAELFSDLPALRDVASGDTVRYGRGSVSDRRGGGNA